MAMQLLPMIGMGVKKAIVWAAEAAVMQRAGNLVSKYLGSDDRPATPKKAPPTAATVAAVAAVTGNHQVEGKETSASKVAKAVTKAVEDNPNMFRASLETLNLAVASLKGMAAPAVATPAPVQVTDAIKKTVQLNRQSAPSMGM